MAPSKFAITVLGTQFTFRRTSTGWFQLLAPKGVTDGSSVDYAREVLARTYAF